MSALRLARVVYCFVASLLCFACVAVSVYGQGGVTDGVTVTARVDRLESGLGALKLDSEHRLTELEAWKTEAQWEQHAIAAGVGGLLLEVLLRFGKRRRGNGEVVSSEA